MRLIDADALEKEGWKLHRTIQVDKNTCEYQTKSLIQIPTIEPKRKTGRWILYENQRQEDVDNGNYLYICSECGKSDIHAKTQAVPFCWWCGAKMEHE